MATINYLLLEVKSLHLINDTKGVYSQLGSSDNNIITIYFASVAKLVSTLMLESFAEPFFSDGTDCHHDIILWRKGFIAQPTQPGQKKAFKTKSDSFAVIVN